MDYCTSDNVKAVLQIGDDKWDSELSECVTSASALVDGLLSHEGLAVPSPVPQILIDSAKYFAAWDFRRRRDPVGAEAFWTEANRLIDVYVGAEQEPTWGVRKVVSEAEVKALIKAGAPWARFSGRISKLPEFLQVRS